MKDTSIFRFNRVFPDEKSAERWFVRERWPGGMRCPLCGMTDVYETKTRKPMPYRCRKCGSYFSVRTGTPLAYSKVPLLKWALAMYLLIENPKSVSSIRLSKQLNVSQTTAWFMAHRIRKAWEDNNPTPFEGPVEVDETYVGGSRRNQHRANRLPVSEARTSKTVIIGMKDRATGKVAAQVVPEPTKKEAERVILPRITPDTLLYTDESNIYMGIAPRETVVHSYGNYVNGDCHTNGIEGVWSLLKRTFHGTYHRVSPKHMQRYCDELTVKQSFPERDIWNMMGDTVRDMEGVTLSYDELVSD